MAKFRHKSAINWFNKDDFYGAIRTAAAAVVPHKTIVMDAAKPVKYDLVLLYILTSYHIYFLKMPTQLVVVLSCVMVLPILE